MVLVRIVSSFLVCVAFGAQMVFAAASDDAVPPCLDRHGEALPVINQQALAWKQSKPNEFHERARLRGLIQNIYKDRNGHDHFVIQIGPDSRRDNVEVVYNQDFGDLPELENGMHVEACGDFIVATGQSGNYPPSPVGAIIHWVHINPSGHGHPSGYVWIEGKLYGQETGSMLTGQMINPMAESL